MDAEQRLCYLATIVQLAERELAQAAATEAAKDAHWSTVNAIIQAGKKLRDGLDKTDTHGQNCFCSRHHRHDVPLRL